VFREIDLEVDIGEVWGIMSFGRRVMDINPEEIKSDLINQVGALKALVEIQGLKLQHAKSYGIFFRSTQLGWAREN